MSEKAADNGATVDAEGVGGRRREGRREGEEGGRKRERSGWEECKWWIYWKILVKLIITSSYS